MQTAPPNRLRAVFCLGVICLSLAPAAFMVGYRFLRGSWVRDSNLAGAWLNQTVVPLTKENWFSGLFQERFSRWFSECFGMRQEYVRLYNQVLYSGFRQTHMLNGELKIGRQDWLYEARYLDDYFQARTNLPPALIDQAAKELKILSAQLSARQKFLVILISPSKASLYPEHTPESYRRMGVKRERNYDVLTNALARAALPFVDSHLLLAQTKPAHPVFTRGASHWNEFGAGVTLNAILAQAGAFFGNPLPQLGISNVSTNFQPNNHDRDLAGSLNLLRTPRRFAATSFARKIDFPPSATRFKLAVVGTSFQWIMLPMAFTPEGSIFKSVRFSYYFHDYVAFGPTGNYEGISQQEGLQTLTDADMVILELNEANFDQDQYWRRFLEQAPGLFSGRDGASLR